MGKITSLFGRGKGGAGPPPRDIAKLVAQFAAPAVQLLPSGAETSSFFGGSPMMPAEAAWPTRDGRPLSFLASIDLRTLGLTYGFDWLPAEGSLSFFYDAEQQPWGFDPKDRGGWAVFHVREGAVALRPPESVHLLPRIFVEFRLIESLPSWERPEIQALELSDREADELLDLSSAVYGDAATHQVGGYPSPVQGDAMELECQLVSNGIYCGDGSAFERPEAKALEAGAADWKLLLQFASDDALDTMWGDMGNLYFWIRRQDAVAGRFDRVWTVLQCS